ncbi:hypothetical protein CUMW_064320 [Citrus unshiu]|nr:hypothetical protein CUMW_064320 [Citrus unshiu]
MSCTINFFKKQKKREDPSKYQTGYGFQTGISATSPLNFFASAPITGFCCADGDDEQYSYLDFNNPNPDPSFTLTETLRIPLLIPLASLNK